MIVAFIPARGGSKRIPKKNIKDFLGKPIIYYSIKNALDSKLFDRVIVSTDSEEIASVAKGFGAEVPFLRPRELADDFSGTNSVVAHGLQAFEKKCQIACCIYPTAPLMRVEDLKNGFSIIKKYDVDFVFSAKKYDYNPFRGFVLKNGTPKMLFPEHKMTRSQDLDEVYHDAAQFYWGRREAFIEDRVLFGKKSMVVPIDPLYVQDIDTLEDWKMAEARFTYLHTK
ncbi:MAG: pseudaminic acid cytidylyltransferase [Campylobacterales bacterium]